MLDLAEKSVIRDIGICKQRILTSFINNTDICDVMFNNTPYTEDDVDNLIYTQIFPYLYIDDTQTETRIYLCVELDIPRFSSGTVKDLQLIIWVYCHKEIMKYSKKGYAGTKVDILADMVERQLRDSYDFGIGKLQPISITNFIPNDKYYGRRLTYNVPDFKLKG